MFDKCAEIEEIGDEKRIDKVNFNFSSIDDIGDMNINDTVDIIGIVYVVGPLASV